MAIFGYLTNRVMGGMLLFFVAVGIWEFRLKPQYRPFYEQAIVSYQSERYGAALEQLQSAYSIAPNAVDVIILMGWIHLKTNQFSEAEYYFGRALRIDPELVEANIGLSFVALETGRGSINLALLKDNLGQRGSSPEIQILIAEALVRQGDHFAAAEIYLRLSSDKDYGHAARVALTQLYGLPEFTSQVPLSFPAPEPPDPHRVFFAADPGGLWKYEGAERRPFSAEGVGLSPAVPNYYPAKPPLDYYFHNVALRFAADLGPRVLVVHTLMPPAFYRAFADRAVSSRPALLQQISFGMPPNRDLFEPSFVEEVKAEIRSVVDSLHGRGEVAPTEGRSGGIYQHDLSASVAGFLLGRELEPSVAIRTNLINGGKTSYRGRYISVDLGNPTEVWYAEMLDHLIDYQATRYGTQSPVSLVNWPPLDPLFHRTEATTADEIRFRVLRGESIGLPEETPDDNDVVSIDESKFRVSERFRAGFFATYNVHPYWPDFLAREAEHLVENDDQGPSAFLGYLKRLRSRIQHPLVIGAYGLPNSIGIARLHPHGWNQGGHTEAEQARHLKRLAQNIRDAGANGGIVESLFDEWHKTSRLTRPFQIPLDRSTLWLNEMEPQSRLGLIGFETSGRRLCEPGAWRSERTLYRPPADIAGAGTGARLLALQASSDEAFLYLKLSLSPGSLENAAVDEGSKVIYAFALNTLPGKSGYRKLPFPSIPLPQGANFLVLIEEGRSRILVAENYYPFQLGLNQTELVLKAPFITSLAEAGPFTEFQVQVNRQSFSRAGEVYPPQRHSWSRLREASRAEGVDPCESEVVFDRPSASIILRLPWGKLLLTDPSSKQGFYGVAEERKILSTPVDGIAVSVFALAADPQTTALENARVTASLLRVSTATAGETALFDWEGWNSVAPQAYSKKSYHALKGFFTGPDGIAPVAELQPSARHSTLNSRSTSD